MNHPHLIVSISLNNFQISEPTLEQLEKAFKDVISTYTSEPYQTLTTKIVTQTIVSMIESFYISIQYPLLKKIIIKIEDNTLRLYIPTLENNIKVSKLALQWIVNILNGNINNLRKTYKELVKLYVSSQPKGVIPYRTLRLCHKNDIPCRIIENDIFQLGWGSKSRLFRSSATDKTPSISRVFTSNKLLTKKLLRSVGLPSALGRLVKSAEDAIALSAQIGYPVVVKPIDQNGGNGVFAGLNSKESMLKAYAKAKKFSPNIMIEKHFEGEDYRMYVLDGELFHAGHRAPATVTGNGKSTVKELITNLNLTLFKENNDLLLKNTHMRFKVLEEDEELFEILKQANLTLDTILDKGKELRLRKITNILSGGTMTPIDLSTIHKDNIELVTKAVEILRLDLAGVDLLIPDISKSWLDVGACFTELNASPGMSADILDIVLKKSVEHNGRIPTVVIVGNNDIEFNQNIIKTVKKDKYNIGISSKDELYKNNKMTSNLKVSNAFESSLRLVNDPSIDAMIVYIEKPSMFFASGLAVDKFDILVLLNSDENTPMNQNYFESLCSMADQVIIEKNFKIEEKLVSKVKHTSKVLDKKNIVNHVATHLRVLLSE
jgi:cyanophycin synthetase